MADERGERLPKSKKGRRVPRPSFDEEVPRVTLGDLFHYAESQMRAGRGDYTVKVNIWQTDAIDYRPELYGRLLLDEINEDDVLKEIHLYYRV